MNGHRHRWGRCCPISPTGDPGNEAARRLEQERERVTHYACDCGAIKMVLELRSRRQLLFLVTRPAPGGRRLWTKRVALRRGRA